MLGDEGLYFASSKPRFGVRLVDCAAVFRLVLALLGMLGCSMLLFLYILDFRFEPPFFPDLSGTLAKAMHATAILHSQMSNTP